MQQIQILLVQTQTALAELAFQSAAVSGLAIVWLVAAFGLASRTTLPDSATPATGVTSVAFTASAWRGLFALWARVVLVLGLLWLTVLAVAWPPLLERAGNVLGPVVAALVTIVLITESVAYRLSQSQQPQLQVVATLFTAVGFTLAMVLVLLGQSWLDAPTGATLIDGRYQVTQWTALFDARGFGQALLAFVFGALLLVAVLVQWVSGGGRAGVLAVSETWQRPLLGLGVAGLLGLFWLLSNAVGGQLSAVTQTTQTFYEALLDGSGNWPLRITFVLWLITLAGLVVRLGSGYTSSEVSAKMMRLPLLTAPVLWVMVCWELLVKNRQDQLAGLPAADLASMQPASVLAFGLLLVMLVVGASLWLLWRFVSRLATMSDGFGVSGVSGVSGIPEVSASKDVKGPQ